MRRWLVLEQGTTREDAEAIDRALLSLTAWSTSRATRLCGTRQALDGRMLLYVPPDPIPIRPDITSSEIDAVVALFDTHVTADTRQDQWIIMDVAKGSRRSLDALLTAEIRRAVRREDVLAAAGLIPYSPPL